MNREEKQQELALEVMTQRVNEMKVSLTSLINKLEHDHRNITNTDFLDSFAVVSGQMNSLMRLLRSDKVPSLKALAVLPLSLNPEKDPTLLQLTEGRIDVFNHDVVPDYLRTKPDPEVEQRHTAVEMRAAQMNSDVANKQPANLTKTANHLLDIINKYREEWESSERTGLPITSSDADTYEMVSSLYSGKAFKTAPIPRQNAPQSSSAPTPAQANKAPGIKTNIKSAASHPYSR